MLHTSTFLYSRIVKIICMGLVDLAFPDWLCLQVTCSKIFIHVVIHFICHLFIRNTCIKVDVGILKKEPTYIYPKSLSLVF